MLVMVAAIVMVSLSNQRVALFVAHLLRERNLPAMNQRLHITERKPKRARDSVVFHVVVIPQRQHGSGPFRKFGERFSQLALSFLTKDAAGRIAFAREIGQGVFERLIFRQFLR